MIKGLYRNNFVLVEVESFSLGKESNRLLGAPPSAPNPNGQGGNRRPRTLGLERLSTLAGMGWEVSVKRFRILRAATKF